MKKIGLYGYGKFGKNVAESFRLFWGNEYGVTAIFDKALYGATDPFWNLNILEPGQIKHEYEQGQFESVMVCIYDRNTQMSLCKMIEDMGIPVFFPGNEADFADPKCFLQDKEPEIIVSEEKYSFHVYRNIFAAVADFQSNMLFLFDDQGNINIDNYKKYYDYFKPYLLSYPFRLREPLPEREYVKGSYCNLVKTYPYNYGHFSLEIADGIYLMETAGYKGKYIYYDTSFSRELLKLMDISSNRLIRVQDLEIHKVYVFEKMYDINHNGLGPLEYSDKVLPKMADLIKKKLIRKHGYPKKIYVKRVGVRKLLNGDSIALKNGFSIIIPEEHSVLDQMTLFYNADIVLCPHGANSTNFLYMHKGAVFVELFSDQWFFNINSKICEANGVHYLHLVGKASYNNDLPDREKDYTVDEDALFYLIKKAEAIAITNNYPPG